MCPSISVSAWNINGISNKVIGDKTKNEDFVNYIKSYDFVFLTETWSSVSVNISGFKAISSNIAPPKSKHKSRPSGGITLLFNNKFQKYVSVVKKSHFSLWCMISKELLNSENDLYLCGVYIPPEQSNYYDIEMFDNLENEAIMFSTKGDVMSIGDFNARTSKLEDFVSTEGNKHVYQFNQDKFNKKKRENFDTTINNHGKRLIEFCKNCDYQILNGRTKGDSLGKPTFHNKNGISTIDYAICDANIIDNINHFIVKPPNYLSDHSQIITCIDIKEITIETSTTSSTNFSNILPRQYIWDNTSNGTFANCLRSSDIQNKVEKFLENNFPENDYGVNECLEEFQDILQETSKRCLKIKKNSKRCKIRNTTNKKWFDKECRLKRHAVRKLANQKHRNPLDVNIRNQYHVTLKDYKNTLKIKKEDFHRQKLIELEKTASENPNSFWKTLKTMDDNTDNTTPNLISEKQWLTHFETLHSKP
ncbi:Hypothetical predicted protein, partial [Paramuricea clavata]